VISPLARSTPPIGLDLGAGTVKAIQVEADGALPRVVAAAWFPRETPGGLPTRREAARLAEVLWRQGFTGRRVAVNAPDDRLLSAAFELNAAGAPLEAVSRVELARNAGCGPQALEVAAWTLPRPARAREASSVLAIGCTHGDAGPWLDALEAAGLDPVAMDARPLALARAGRALTAPRTGICAAVDVDWAVTTACVLYHDSIVYHRATGETSLSAAAANIRECLGLPEDAVLRLLSPGAVDGAAEWAAAVEPLLAEHAGLIAAELEQAVAYAWHRYPDQTVDLVLVGGDGAGLPGLAGEIASRVETEVRMLRPTEVAGCLPGLEPIASSPSLAVALGLSLWKEGTEP
jgi:Tfp pilus assembly PilM family ATPase